MGCLLSLNTCEALSKKAGRNFRPCTGKRQETARSILYGELSSDVGCIRLLVLWVCILQGCVHLVVIKLFGWRESHLASVIRIQALHLSNQILIGREQVTTCSLGSCTILHHSEEETVISPVVAVEAPFNLSSHIWVCKWSKLELFASGLWGSQEMLCGSTHLK